MNSCLLGLVCLLVVIITKAFWREQTGRAMKSFSPIRSVVEQVQEQLGDINQFLSRYDIGSPATLAKLKGVLLDTGNRSKKVYLQIELASVVDYRKHFVYGTYSLEGDGPFLVFSYYEVIQKIQAAIHAGYTPNIDAVIRNLSSGVQREMQLRAYSRRCVQPGLDYFDRQPRTNLQDALAVFKSAQLFSPHKVQILQPTATDINSLSIIPFLNNDDTLSGLKKGLPAYIAKCIDVGSATE